jgi:phosphoglycolate phosphatase
MIRGVLFDLDGTLINSIDCYWLAFNGGLEKFKLGPVDVPTIASHLDKGARIRDILMAICPSLDEAAWLNLQKEIRDVYINLEKEHVRLLPGARELLAALKSRGIKVGIATSRMTKDDGKWRDVRRFGLADYIDVVVTAADSKPKPAPDTVIECVKQLGLETGQCIFIGDSTCDIVAAREAGMISFAVTTGVGIKPDLIAAGPEAVFDNLNELAPHLERLTSTTS